MIYSGKSFKIFLSVFVLGFTMWFGGNIIRTAIAYDMFLPGSIIELKQDYTEEILSHSIYLYAITSAYTSSAFILMALASILLAIKLKSHLKPKAWLFMAAVLYAIALPAEIYRIYADSMLNMAIFWDGQGSASSLAMKTLFFDRLANQNLSIFTTISFLSIITAILYLIWQPLDSSNSTIDSQLNKGENEN